MKKALKITGITLASLIGLVLIVAGIAVAMLTSSGRLTKMLKHYAPQFVNCEMELDRANLTLFKTFPNVGVDIEHVALINPMEGSPSDTLANIDDLAVVLDIKKMLKEKKIVVRQCVLEKALVNIYIDSVGNSNLNVFNTKEDKDTTSVSFDYLVDIEEIKLKNSTMFFTNDFSHLAIQAKGFDLNLNGTFQDNDIHAELGMKVDDFNLMNYATPFALKNVNLGFNGDVTQFDQIKGVLTLDKPDIHLNINEPSMGDDTLSISLPVQFSIKQLLGHYDKGQIGFKDYRLFVDGGVEIADGKIVFDFDVNSNAVALERLLPYLPEALQKELNANGPHDMLNLTVAGAKVTINPSLAPHIQIKIQADNLALNMSSLPYPIMDLNFDVLLANDLTKKTSNSIEVNGLRVKFKHSNLDAKGLVGDLSGDVLLRLNAEGDVLLSDVKNFLPETMNLKGHTNFNLATDFTVDKLKKTLEDYNLNRLSAKADLKFSDLAFDMDTIHVTTPQFNVNLVLPASSKQKGKTGTYLAVDSKALEAQVGTQVNANMKHADIRLFADNFKGGIKDIMLDAELTLGHAAVKIDGLDENINVNNVNFHFNPNILDFKNCTFRLGQSDLSLQGSVIGIKDWIENHGNLMKGEFQLNTDLLNVKEIVELINELNITKDSKPKDTESKEISPFIVPTGIDLAVDVKTKQTVYGSLDFNDLSGTITMKDSTLILHELSFTNKAADMQLSALYQSQDKDNLFFAMDFHLLNVQINDLLHLVPYFDTLVPMLKTFDGQCEFNIDVETNLGSNYHPKISTLRAAADVKGKDLTVNDQFTFTKITDLLGVSTDGEYRVDSLDVQLAFFENKLNLWPSQIAIGKYKAVADGFMTLDKNAEYHIALTESPFPMHHGLKISGPLDQLKFKLEDSKYPNHYKPLKRSERKQFHQNLRKMIADKLREKKKQKP